MSILQMRQRELENIAATVTKPTCGSNGTLSPVFWILSPMFFSVPLKGAGLKVGISLEGSISLDGYNRHGQRETQEPGVPAGPEGDSWKGQRSLVHTSALNLRDTKETTHFYTVSQRASRDQLPGK